MRGQETKGQKTNAAKPLADHLERQHGEIRALVEEMLPRLDEIDQLKDQLADRRITVQTAEAARPNAQLERQAAEIPVAEYTEDTFQQEVETAKGEIALAEAGLKRAKDRALWSDKAFEKGHISRAQNLADHQALDKATLQLEQARTNLEVLQKFTKDRRIKELRGVVEKARADEMTKQATLELERAKLKRLETLVEKQKLSDREGRTLVLLKETIQRHDQARAQTDPASSLIDQAQSKLEKAQRLWHEEVAQRTTEREAQLKARIVQAAEVIRSATR